MFNLKTKLFFLPIEIKSRELYPKLYFAKKAMERNYSIFIGDKAGIFRATIYFNSVTPITLPDGCITLLPGLNIFSLYFKLENS